jgi:hypothetical protein
VLRFARGCQPDIKPLRPRHTHVIYTVHSRGHVIWLHNVQNHGCRHGYHIVHIKVPETLHGTEFAGQKNQNRSVLSSTHAPVLSPLLRSGADGLCVSATQDLEDEQLSQNRNWCVNQPTLLYPQGLMPRSIHFILRVLVCTKGICNM